MTPKRIQRLSEELEVIFKSLRSSDATDAATAIPADGNMEGRQYPWVLVVAVLGVVVVIIIILVIAIPLSRRVSRSRLERTRKRYFVEANRR